jgi:hypothetical protein
MRYSNYQVKALKALFLCSAFTLSACSSITPLASQQSPSDHFDLTHWKLQYPGSTAEPKPRETKPVAIAGFSNEFFYLDRKSKNMVFSLNADAPGSTTNSPFVRSELREEIVANEDKINWSALEGTHELTTELKVGDNTLTEDKVTVVQVHGGQAGGFTLLRAVFEDKNLIVYYKADNTKLNEKSVIVGPGYDNDYTKFNVKIENSRLSLSVNGQKKLDVDIAYWNWPSYFKVGAYPQTNQPGKVSVMVKSVSATHTNPRLLTNP